MQATVAFEDFDSENMPSKNSAAEQELQSSLASAIASALGVPASNVRIIRMWLWDGDRRHLTRLLKEAELNVEFEVEYPDNEEEATSAVTTQLQEKIEDGIFIEEVRESESGDIFTGVTAKPEVELLSDPHEAGVHNQVNSFEAFFEEYKHDKVLLGATGLLLLAVLLICCCCCCLRKKEDERVDELYGNPMNDPGWPNSPKNRRSSSLFASDNPMREKKGG